MNLLPVFDKMPTRLAGCLILSALLLFVGLGSFGMWEPHELAHAETAEKLLKGEAVKNSASLIEERLAALSWSFAGKSELATRLPIALLALFTVTALFLLVRPLLGAKLATLSTLFFLSSPLLLYHGRQLTSGIVPILGEVLALLGLSLVVFGESKRAFYIGSFAALAGLALGFITKGALVGIAGPLAVVSAALLTSGNAASFFKSDSAPERRIGMVTLVAGGLAILFAGAYFAAVLFPKSHLSLVLGGTLKLAGYKMTFDFPFEQLAYGWFPWSALAPISVVGFFLTEEQDKKRLFMRALSISGILIGYLFHAISLETVGLSACTVAAPMALAAAFAVDDMANAKAPLRLMVFIGVAMFALMIRDFIQNPVLALSGYGFDNVPIPEKDYKPIVILGLFALPAGLLIATGFLGRGKWRKWQFRILVPLAPVVLGAGLSFYLVPYYSVHLSSKHAIQTYEKFRKGNEPLAVLGPGRFFSKAKKLKNKKEAVEWLSRSDRVFAMFPPRYLPDLDQQMRKRTGRHLFVLDAESDRFMVATSKALSKEKNENPLAPYTSSKLFEPGPSHPMEVNFDDKVTFLGWDLETDGRSDRLRKGREMVFTSYWRVDNRIPGDYKIFMHFDGPGGRLHGDHEPFEGKFKTGDWAKGDFIKEIYRKKIPSYQASGTYRVRMGLFKGSGRLPIKDDPKAKENAMFIGSIVLK